MQFLPYIYLFYIFVSLYFLFFYIINYISNRKKIFEHPAITRNYPVSVIIPSYNEEETIEGTVLSVLKSRYKPVEIIIVNDNSKDRTREIAESLAKRYPIVKVINNTRNLRRAGSLNKAIKIAKGELIAAIDSDSYLQKDAIENLIGFFDDPQVGVATAKVLVKKKTGLLEKLQALEYSVIAWTRKLLGFVDCIYVTTGPLSIYRKSAIIKTGGFDDKNMTEDIEMTWHLISCKYKVKMSLASHVETVAPNKLRMWYRQRQRWNIGGLQCLNKYKSLIFSSAHNMLGLFIIPYFVATLILGLTGLGIFSYLIIRRIISFILLTKYSSLANVPVVTLNQFYFTASILNYLGVVLFIFGLFFTIFALRTIKPKGINIYSPLVLLIYLLVYLTIYPFILVTSIIRIIIGDYGWW